MVYTRTVPHRAMENAGLNGSICGRAEADDLRLLHVMVKCQYVTGPSSAPWISY